MRLVTESNNNNVIGFIASTVEKLRDDVAEMRSQMVTRDTFDAAIVAVRGDIEQVPTPARHDRTLGKFTLRTRRRRPQ